MKGQVLGVSITQGSGQPGNGSSIRIRGVGTTGDNGPLFIVDRMAVDGGIDNLNPADITSVEILKDAASATVYGTRGTASSLLLPKAVGKGKPKYPTR